MTLAPLEPVWASKKYPNIWHFLQIEYTPEQTADQTLQKFLSMSLPQKKRTPE